MQLFVMPESYRIMKVVESTADESKQKELGSVVYEVMDTDTGDIYYFKHGMVEKHTIYHQGKEVPIGLNTAKELLSMTYAEALGVKVCTYHLAYFPVLNKYGILTKKESIQAYPLFKLVQRIEKQVGSINTIPYKVAFSDYMHTLPIQSLIDMYKIQACDILIQNKDRHENNILFTDADYRLFYPYFDCDTAFFSPKGSSLKGVTLQQLLVYNLMEFRLFNIASCLSLLLKDNYRKLYEEGALLLKQPSRALIEDTLNTLNLANHFKYFADYLYDIVGKFNDFMKDALAKDYEEFMLNLMRFIPR